MNLLVASISRIALGLVFVRRTRAERQWWAADHFIGVCVPAQEDANA